MSRARSTSALRVLIADDQPEVLAALRLLLKNEGMEATSVGSPAAVLHAVKGDQFDVALIDLNYARDTTSGREGLELLQELQGIDPELPVIVMTAWATIDLAVESMRRGARDFLGKPWENARLVSALRNQGAYGREARRARRLEAENELLAAVGDEPVVADSAAMRTVIETVQRIAASDAPVLITGENGTGKGLVARLVHKLSTRAAQSFIAVNLGSIPDSLFESEMFGHVKGAFTDARADRIGRFELADGGTLFLDEIGNLSASSQAKLLRVLETGEFERVGSSRTQRTNARLIAATNAVLADAVAAGAFRQDLVFRLNTIEIRMPPLRERPEDIVAIAHRRLHESARKYSRPVRGLSAGALEALRAYAWPGNVRELNNVIERAVLMGTGAELLESDLRLQHPSGPARAAIEDMKLDDAERLLIRTALRRSAGNVPAAAEALGLSRSAMYRRLEKLGIPIPAS